MTPRFRVAALVAACLALATASRAQAPDWPSERPPRPLPAREVKFPPYQFRTLANGLQVIAVSHHEQPAVSLRLIVRAGGAQDPQDKPGVANLAAALLDQGTTTRSAENIATTIDSIGGAIGTGAVTDLTFLNAAVMKDSLDLALDLVADLARNPTFAPQEIERQRQQILSGLQVSYDDPAYLAGVVFDRLVFGFHPYGKPGSGTPDSIRAITRSDLSAFHKKWFGANNAILAVVGDIEPEEALKSAERAFGSWGRVELSDMKPVDPPPPTGRVVIIDRPGAVQTEIRVGNIALPRRHPDYFALDIATKILGGEGGNRLHRVLRSERGLTYGASADLNALKESGDIVAETDTRSATTGQTLRLIVDEISRLQRQRVQSRELDDAQAYLTGSFPLTIETPSAIALQVLNAVFYGLDLNELQTYRERVNAVTVDDIQRVAQQYLHPDRLTIVLVGDASVFARQLPGVGFDRVEQIPLASLDLSSPDLRRHAGVGGGRIEPIGFQTQASRSAGETTPRGEVRELIARALQAKGGVDLLQSIRTIKMTTTMKVLDGGAAPMDVSYAIRYPGGFRVDAQTPSGPLVQVFNNGDFWVQDEAHGVRAAPPQYAAEMRANIQRDMVPLLLALAAGKVSATRLADATQAGRTLAVLEVNGAGMRPTRLMVDPETGLIARQRYVGADSAVTEEAFSDYRDINGLKVAFRTTVYRDGTPVLERTVRSFQYNVPLEPALFTRPS
jgi:zinc protease